MIPVIIPVRNSVELTKRAVASILAQDVPVQIYIVDNCSSDATDRWLQEQIPRVVSWRFCPGLGVSASWNFALSVIFRTYDYCAVLNNDLILRKDCLRELLDDGGGFVTAVSVDNILGIETEFVKSVRPHRDFSCFLIRRHVWKTVGPFDETMVHYCSDGDYHLRMHRAGIPAYTIGMPFYHYASGTLKHATELDRRFIEQQADTDRDTFYRKHGVKIGAPEYYALFNSEAP